MEDRRGRQQCCSLCTWVCWPSCTGSQPVSPSAVFVHLLLGTAMVLVGVLVAAALLYWYWIEVVLLCRTYRSKDDTLRGKITQHAIL